MLELIERRGQVISTGSEKTSEVQITHAFRIAAGVSLAQVKVPHILPDPHQTERLFPANALIPA